MLSDYIDKNKKIKVKTFKIGDWVQLREHPSIIYCIDAIDTQNGLYNANLDDIYPNNRMSFYTSEIKLCEEL